MHTSPPAPYTATQVAHLVGGPLCGESHEIPAECSALSFDKDGDAQYWDGDPAHIAIPLAGHAYFYSIYATQLHGRQTFIHSTMPWHYASPTNRQSGQQGQ